VGPDGVHADSTAEGEGQLGNGLCYYVCQHTIILIIILYKLLIHIINTEYKDTHINIQIIYSSSGVNICFVCQLDRF